MARRAVYISHGPARAAHPDPREPEQLGVRVVRRCSAPFVPDRANDGSTVRLPRRLSHRRTGGAWKLSDEDVGRWLRAEPPRQVAQSVDGDATLPAIAWGGEIGELHLRRHLLRFHGSRWVRTAIAELAPWAGHPALTLAVWWEVCFLGRGLGFPKRLKVRTQARDELDWRLRWTGRTEGAGIPAEEERRLRSSLMIAPYRLARDHVGRLVRFVEVWIDKRGSSPTYSLEEAPGVELLVRTLTPVRVVGPGVDFEAAPDEPVRLRCDEQGWTRIEAPRR